MKAKPVGLIIAAIATLLATHAWAATPTPDPSPSATEEPTITAGSASVQGVRYALKVLDETANPVPDGTIVEFVNANIGPPANADAIASHEPCAQAVVHGGLAKMAASFDTGCPPGTRIVPTLFFPGQVFGYVYQANPAIDWRAATVTGETLGITLLPIQPPTGGDAGTIQPPNTGDAGLR